MRYKELNPNEAMEMLIKSDRPIECEVMYMDGRWEKDKLDSVNKFTSVPFVTAYDYFKKCRVLIEPDYRPLESDEELLSLLGKVIVSRYKMYNLVTTINLGTKCVYMGNREYDTKLLFQQFTFQSGEPVGIKIERN